MSSNWYVFLFAVVSVDSLCAHYRIWQLKKSAADTVAAALGTTVDVDGVALPAVDDAWKPDSAIGRLMLSSSHWIPACAGMTELTPGRCQLSACRGVGGWHHLNDRCKFTFSSNLPQLMLAFPS